MVVSRKNIFVLALWKYWFSPFFDFKKYRLALTQCHHFVGRSYHFKCKLRKYITLTESTVFQPQNMMVSFYFPIALNIMQNVKILSKYYQIAILCLGLDSFLCLQYCFQIGKAFKLSLLLFRQYTYSHKNVGILT